MKSDGFFEVCWTLNVLFIYLLSNETEKKHVRFSNKSFSFDVFIPNVKMICRHVTVYVEEICWKQKKIAECPCNTIIMDLLKLFL